jgi:hypothetical protein
MEIPINVQAALVMEDFGGDPGCVYKYIEQLQFENNAMLEGLKYIEGVILKHLHGKIASGELYDACHSNRHLINTVSGEG